MSTMSTTMTENLIYWPEATGFLAKIKNASRVGNQWNDIPLEDLETLIGTILHDPKLNGDTVILDLIFKTDGTIRSIKSVGHEALFTPINAYRHDDVEEFFSTEVKEAGKVERHIRIAAQVYGDFWEYEEAKVG